MVYITRRETFNAAHKVFRPDWSDEKNREVFGKCSNPNWHGHNYTLYVTVKGKPDPDTGFVVNLKTLSKLIREEVTNSMDHRNINLEVDFMQGVMPTTENLVVAIWKQLEPGVRKLGCTLHSVKLRETENNSAEYFGE